MLATSVGILVFLIIILAASEVFTNALEHLGQHWGISEGVTGSLLAAVGTALPEASVPLLALFFGTSDAHTNAEIGIGAILGAPLMLSTLSLFLLAVFSLKKRGLRGVIRPEKQGFCRDMDFFLGALLLSLGAMFVSHTMMWAKVLLAVSLVLLYVWYVYLTLRSSSQLVLDGHKTTSDRPLFLQKIGIPLHYYTMILQLCLGLVLLVVGAKGFIWGVEGVSKMVGMSAFLLSLFIVPIATELPEKLNSILWVRKNKDTLAVGNITGALVFQGTILPAIGILLTPWQPDKYILYGVFVTLLASLWLRFQGRDGSLPLASLWVNGVLYAAFFLLVL